MIIFPKFNNPTGFNKIGKDIYYIYIFTKVANFSGFIKNWENNKRYYLVWLRQTKWDELLDGRMREINSEKPNRILVLNR